MDKNSRLILRETMRYLNKKGYKVISEFALPNKKRVDLIALNSKKEILIIEVKSKIKDLSIDKKWKNYLNYCNFFYFAFIESPKNIDIIEKKIGVIKANKKETIIIRKPKHYKMNLNKKNNLIFNIALSAASKFHRLIDPKFKKQKNNSIYIYKKG